MTTAALLHRRTVRDYVPDQVIPKDVIEKIVKAALWSPTGMNVQDIDLVVVTNRAKLDEVTSVALPKWPVEFVEKFEKRKEDYGVKNVVTCDAPCAIFLVKNDRENALFNQIDTGIMVMSIIVAAQEFGLESMCLGCLLRGEPVNIENALGIPPGKLVMAVALGKPKDKVQLVDKQVLCTARYIE